MLRPAIRAGPQAASSGIVARPPPAMQASGSMQQHTAGGVPPRTRTPAFGGQDLPKSTSNSKDEQRSPNIEPAAPGSETDWTAGRSNRAAYSNEAVRGSGPGAVAGTSGGAPTDNSVDGSTGGGSDGSRGGLGPKGYVTHYNMLADSESLMAVDALAAAESLAVAAEAKAAQAVGMSAPLLPVSSVAQSKWQDKSQQTSFRRMHSHITRAVGMKDNDDGNNGVGLGTSGGIRGGDKGSGEDGGSLDLPESPFSRPGSAPPGLQGPLEMQPQQLNGRLLLPLKSRSLRTTLKLGEDVSAVGLPPEGVDKRLEAKYPGE
ncbi:hypothetical protein PLESTB_000107100 [Pleodorina starrii]|uniref:Uncharacterized protein n=1 Tax=Pleodorina starrii TaxID=330485 RepID=A0A9W6BAG8_9CHLO|nr:hypothetical protein PLESTB_000107100 [Pleodorina starrii]